jgi:putative ABC transport system permease protein
MTVADWLRRSALRAVPSSWRESVRQDLEEDAGAGLLSGGRASLEAVAVGVGLHWTFTGGALMSDIRYAIRSLLYARWFTLGAVCTFAVGIGVNGAVFALVDRALFRPLPFAAPDRLVLIADGAYYQPESPFVGARRSAAAFTDIGSVAMADQVAIEGPDAPSLRISPVTYNAFDLLGVSPIVGRPFTREDAQSGTKFVLLKEEVWRSRFGSDPHIVGRRWIVGPKSYEVIGVLPAGLISPTVNWSVRTEAYSVADDVLETATAQSSIPAPIARLKPGVTIAQAQAAFDAAWAATSSDRSAAEDKFKPKVQPLQAAMFWNFRTEAMLLAAGGAIVWLVACVNLGTLVLARSRSRERDVAVRASLGASSVRIISTAAIESVLLAGAGGGVALGALALALRSLEAMVPSFADPLFLPAIDRRMAIFALVGTMIGAGIAALYPVVRAMRRDPYAALDRGPASGRQARSRVARALLVAESTLATALVLAGLLAVTSFAKLLQTDVGFITQDIYNVGVTPPPADDAARFEFFLRGEATIRRMPGVLASSVTDAPWFGGGSGDGFKANGTRISIVQASDGYFDTGGTRVSLGAPFSETDVRASAAVAIVSRAAASALFPNEDPATAIGRTVNVPRHGDRRIVGVAEDARMTPASPISAALYVPPSPLKLRAFFLVRTRPGVAPDPRAITAGMAADVATPIHARVDSATGYFDGSLQNPRLYARLFGAFALIALVLAAVGLFAMTSFDVALRRYEMGIRMTLGAGAHEIRRLVIGDAVRPVLIGVLLGSAAAFWAAKYFQSLLPNLSARNPFGYVAVGVVLIATAAAAAFIPARHAAQADPAAVLRAQ